MWQSLRTILFFMLRGLLLGFGLGIVSGTLIIPFFGTVYAALWGAGMGVSLGFVTGLLVALLNIAAFHPDMDLTQYRRRLALGTGIFNAAGAMALLLVTTEGFLWNYYPGMVSPFTTLNPLLLVIMAIGAAGSGLASAYTASHFADWYSNLMLKRKNEDIAAQQTQPTERQGFLEYMRIAYRFSRIPMGIAAVFSVPYAILSYRITLMNIFVTVFETAAYIFILTTLLGLVNAAAITFLNRLLFNEYVPHQPPEKYKVSLMVMMFLLTLIASFSLTAGFLSPVAATCAALVARRYADWYIATSRTPAGVKRDAAHQAAIQRLSKADSAAAFLPEDAGIAREAART